MAAETEGGAHRRVEPGCLATLGPHDIQPEPVNIGVDPSRLECGRHPSLTQTHHRQNRLQGTGAAQEVATGGLGRRDRCVPKSTR